MAIDFGTGDGSFAYALAKADPSLFVIGADSNASGLAEISARALRKPAKGGLENLIFVKTSLEHSPGELAGLADRLTVILPWGSLLRAVTCGEVEPLRALCKPRAEFEFVFGYEAGDQLTLPVLTDAHVMELAVRMGARAQRLELAELRAIPSTWAKKLAYSGRSRPIWRLRRR